MDLSNSSSPANKSPTPAISPNQSIPIPSIIVDLSSYNNQANQPINCDFLEGLTINDKGDVYFKSDKNPMKLTLSQKLMLLKGSDKAEEYEDKDLGEAIRMEIMRILGSKDFYHKYGKQNYSQEELDEYMKNEIFQRTTMKKHGEEIRSLLSATPSPQASQTVVLGFQAPAVEDLHHKQVTPPVHSSSNTTSPYAAKSWAKEEEEASPPGQDSSWTWARAIG